MLFAAEILFRLVAMGPTVFIRSRWNVFDTTVVSGSLLGYFYKSAEGLSIFRTLRLVSVVGRPPSPPTRVNQILYWEALPLGLRLLSFYTLTFIEIVPLQASPYLCVVIFAKTLDLTVIPFSLRCLSETL